jgi:hypothetical protein
VELLPVFFVGLALGEDINRVLPILPRQWMIEARDTGNFPGLGQVFLF